MEAYQTAQLDANGNGLPNEYDDLEQLKVFDFPIGREYQVVELGRTRILDVTPDAELNGQQSVSMRAGNLVDPDGDRIVRVWVEILPPNSPVADDGLTVTQTIEVDLLDGDGDGMHEGVYDQSSSEGTYVLMHYAVDESGLFSKPRISFVTQLSGVADAVPDAYEVDDSPASAKVADVGSPMAQHHTFHVADDVDWLKFFAIAGEPYVIKVETPGDVAEPEITLFGPDNAETQISAGDISHDQANGTHTWQCEEDGVYWIRVENGVQYFGANAAYTIKVYIPTAVSLPGYLTGTVSSNGQPVSGAVLRSSKGGSLSSSNGRYFMMLSEGGFTVSAAKAGYEGTSFSTSVVAGRTTRRDVQMVKINHPPVINGSPGTTAYTNEQYLFQPQASDPDGDSLTFTVSGLPVWCSFSTVSGTVQGVPSDNHIGKYGPVHVSVKDPYGGEADLGGFYIDVVKGENHPPVISGSSPKIIGAGVYYAFTPYAYDQDGDKLTFQVSGLPVWAGFNTSNGTVYGTPLLRHIGSHGPLTITVTDSKGAAGYLRPFSLQVVHTDDLPPNSPLPAMFMLLLKE